MSDAPERIWAEKTWCIYFGRSFVNGCEDMVTEYIRADLCNADPRIAALVDALRDTAALAQAATSHLGDTSEFLIGGVYRRTRGEILNAADAALAAMEEGNA